jgi:lysyl-tRNA synthetase class 2
VIQTFDYDDGERRLIVRFVSGLVYAYAGVPAEIAAGLREASSKGHYFTESIRDRFPFTRLRAGWTGRRTSGRGDATLHEER